MNSVRTRAVPSHFVVTGKYGLQVFCGAVAGVVVKHLMQMIVIAK